MLIGSPQITEMLIICLIVMVYYSIMKVQSEEKLCYKENNKRTYKNKKRLTRLSLYGKLRCKERLGVMLETMLKPRGLFSNSQIQVIMLLHLYASSVREFINKAANKLGIKN